MNKIDLKTVTSFGGEFEALAFAGTGLVHNAGCHRFDVDAVIEEFEHLGGSEKSEIRNRMRVLLAHLIKWHFQPKQRSNSWRATLTEQRREIAAVVRRNPSLKNYPADAIPLVYGAAAASAARETGLQLADLPAKCPYPTVHILDQQFFPGPK